MKRLLALLLLVALVCGGWYFASPWLAMKGVADAAMDNNAAALEERVDFAAVRESANAQLGDAVREQSGQGGLLGELGGAVAEQLGREAIDRALTPQNIGNVVRYGSLGAGLLPERLRGQELDWSVEREGLDSFRARGTFEDGTPGPVLLFERDGLGWVMTGFELPTVVR